MTMLDNVTKSSGSGVPEWLATHPDPGNRRQLIQNDIDTMSANFGGYTVDQKDYYSHVNNIVFGKDPRQGYFQGSKFYQPDLKFQITFPNGWQTENQVAAVLAGSPDQNALVQVSFAQSNSAGEAAGTFFGQQGLTASNTASGNINNVSASWGDFRASSQSGELAGVAYFYAYGGKVYQVLAFGTTDGWSKHEPEGRAAARSFAPLTDREKLDVTPWRIDIIRADKATTLQALKDRYNSPATLDQLALINRVDKNSPISSGQEIKMIVGKPLP